MRHNGDQLPLQDFLDAMHRMKVAPSGITGYKQGFNGEQVADWSQSNEGFAYRVGYGNGRRARERGAHSDARKVS